MYICLRVRGIEITIKIDLKKNMKYQEIFLILLSLLK